MSILFPILAIFGSVAAVTAAETYSNYRNYFDSQPAPAHSTERKSVRKTARPAHAIDPRRYDEGSVSKNPDNLIPGYRGAAGTYVPPDYSTHPNGLAGDGFGSSASQSYGSVSAPNPFGGTLGTRL